MQSRSYERFSEETRPTITLSCVGMWRQFHEWAVGLSGVP